ncbi:MAG: phage scaffolding protein [Clostridia bacterium]|nr:phage scaffolding protein [Clostridia bacterium]
MNLNEIFKAQGIEDGIVNAILTAMKENKIYTTNEENLDVRYGKLKTDFDGKSKELAEANNLIAELKKSNKGNEDMQGKITAYETQVGELQKELQQTKLDAAIKVALLSEKATDVDYMTFKLKEKGELELDENEHIKGWEDKIAALKMQFPNQFENSGSKKVEEHKLDRTDEHTGYTKSDLLRKSYAERTKIYEENPEAYAEAMKG